MFSRRLYSLSLPEKCLECRGYLGTKWDIVREEKGRVLESEQRLPKRVSERARANPLPSPPSPRNLNTLTFSLKKQATKTYKSTKNSFQKTRVNLQFFFTCMGSNKEAQRPFSSSLLNSLYVIQNTWLQQLKVRQFVALTRTDIRHHLRHFDKAT